MPSVGQKQPRPLIELLPDREGKQPPPPPAGSFEESAETALAVGWPGAFGVTCSTVEQVIRYRLLWRAE
jgi:hypothetical protein